METNTMNAAEVGNPAAQALALVAETTPVDRREADVFSVGVQPQFLLQDRAPSLPSSKVPTLNPSSTSISGQGKDHGGGKRNKKRPRDTKIQEENKMCRAILRGETCPYGAEKCKYLHDIQHYLCHLRPPDIEPVDLEGRPLVEDGVCPIFKSQGYCPYGIVCRFGSSHIHKETGENMGDPSKSQPASVKNILPSELQVQLRKNLYPFHCQRKKNTTLEGKSSSKPAKHTSNVEDVDSTNNFSDPLVESALIPTSNSTGTARSHPITEVANGNKDLPYPEKTRKLIDFSNKVYVAPLTTVGNLPFRRIMKYYGADITCGEMAIATNILEGKASEWALLKRHACEDVFGVQLAAGYPDVYTRTVELIENSYIDADFVDLNLGCPIDLVCQKGAGAALMQREKRLQLSLQGILSTLHKCPITIKMRTGWDEKCPMAHELVQKIHTEWGYSPSNGLNAIMIHGRSRLQRYSREANWEYIDRIALQMSSKDSSDNCIPIIGNGDIMSYMDYQEKIAQNPNVLPCAMLGRGALIKPWLPTEIKESRHMDISASERLDILRNFVHYGLEHWGSDQQGVNNCRRFLLEWLSFLHRYIPVGIMEHCSIPQRLNQRPPKFVCGRNDLETLFMSSNCYDWIKISEMLLGPVPDGFQFEPKHKANSYQPY
jgi:tRNA-dihydrouridine synthase 3